MTTGDIPRSISGDVGEFVPRHPDPTRVWATVYERAAWHHDIGRHAGVEYPYLYCPRCEMEHPKGRYAKVRGVLEEAREELARWGWGDMHYGVQDQDKAVLAMVAKIDLVLNERFDLLEQVGASGGSDA